MVSLGASGTFSGLLVRSSMPADKTKRGIPKPSFLSHPLLIDSESCEFYDIILGEILPKPRPCTSQAKSQDTAWQIIAPLSSAWLPYTREHKLLSLVNGNSGLKYSLNDRTRKMKSNSLATGP